MTVAGETQAGEAGWALRVDGRRYGWYPDLEEVNRLLARLGVPDPVPGGAALCDWREDTAELPAKGGPRPNAGARCGLFASRTVIWESPGMFGVRLCCDAHVRVYRAVSPDWVTWVLPRPVPRGDPGGRGPGFDKRDAGDMRRLRALLAGRGLPPGAIPGVR